MTLKISYMGGKQAGMIGLLTALSKKHEISVIASYSTELSNTSSKFCIPTYTTIKDPTFIKKSSQSDIILCVHGREKVPQTLINLTKYKLAVNVHPYLYKYKGINPIGRAIHDKCYRASVGAHYMTDKYDEGKVIDEQFIDIIPTTNPIEVYNQLYYLYEIVVSNTLDIISHESSN